MVPSSSLETDTALVPETAGTPAATAATSPATAAAAAVTAAARTGPDARVSKAALATKLLSLSGVFAVHKPKGPTSAELLNRLKEKLLAGTAARVGTRPRRRPRQRKLRGANGLFFFFFFLWLKKSKEGKGGLSPGVALGRSPGPLGLGLAPAWTPLA